MPFFFSKVAYRSNHIATVPWPCSTRPRALVLLGGKRSRFQKCHFQNAIPKGGDPRALKSGKVDGKPSVLAPQIGPGRSKLLGLHRDQFDHNSTMPAKRRGIRELAQNGSRIQSPGILSKRAFALLERGPRRVKGSIPVLSEHIYPSAKAFWNSDKRKSPNRAPQERGFLLGGRGRRGNLGPWASEGRLSERGGGRGRRGNLEVGPHFGGCIPGRLRRAPRAADASTRSACAAGRAAKAGRANGGGASAE